MSMVSDAVTAGVPFIAQIVDELGEGFRGSGSFIPLLRSERKKASSGTGSAMSRNRLPIGRNSIPASVLTSSMNGNSSISHVSHAQSSLLSARYEL